MARKRQAPNISIRIAIDDDFPDLHKLARGTGRHLKRLVAELSLEVFDWLGVLKDDFPVPSIIRPIRFNNDLRPIAHGIAHREKKTLPMNKTRPTRVHFSGEEREYLKVVSERLHWAHSYVVWEAVRSALFFASFEGKLPSATNIPDIIKLYQGVGIFEATQGDTLNKINERYKMRSTVQIETQVDAVTIDPNLNVQ